MRSYFETFGFLRVPDALPGEIGRIKAAIDAALKCRLDPHDPERRSVFLLPAEHELSLLAEHPTISALVTAVLGPTRRYIGAEISLLNGDGDWHRDGPHAYLAMAIYPDELDGETGALRVVPGSAAMQLDPWWDSERNWGIPGRLCGRWQFHQFRVMSFCLITKPRTLHSAAASAGACWTLNFACPNAASTASVDIGQIAQWHLAVARSRQMAGMLDPKLPKNPLPDTIELLLGLNRVTKELLTRQIVAMDVYAKGTHEPIDFVGRLMLSPFPCLVKDVERAPERGANLVPAELESQPRSDLP